MLGDASRDENTKEAERPTTRLLKAGTSRGSQRRVVDNETNISSKTSVGLHQPGLQPVCILIHSLPGLSLTRPLRTIAQKTQDILHHTHSGLLRA